MHALIIFVFVFVSFQEKSIRACGSLEMAPSLAPPPIDAVFLRLCSAFSQQACQSTPLLDASSVMWLVLATRLLIEVTQKLRVAGILWLLASLGLYVPASLLSDEEHRQGWVETSNGPPSDRISSPNMRVQSSTSALTVVCPWLQSEC